MIITLNNGSLPIKPITEIKIEAQVSGGLATIKQKRAVVVAELALSAAINPTGNQNDSMIFHPGSKVYLVPDAAHHTWNKTVLSIDGVDFVLAPLSAVVGVEIHAVPTEGHDH